MQTPRDSTPGSATGSTTPPGKQVAESGAPVTPGRIPGRFSGSPWPSQSKSQEPGPELSLWVIQMDSLEAADCSSVLLTSLMTLDKSLNLSFFILNSVNDNFIHTFWEVKPPIHSVSVSPLLCSSVTTSGPVLWTQDRKVLRGHSGRWVCDQKQDSRI